MLATRMLGGVLAALLVGTAAFAQPAGARLPTGWSLSASPSTRVTTGTFPQSVTFTADGQHLLVAEAGAALPSVRFLDPQTLAYQGSLAVRGLFGAPSPDASGSGFWVAMAGAGSVEHADAATGRVDRTIALPAGFWPAQVARSPDSRSLAVSGLFAAQVALIDLRSGTIRTLPVGRSPGAIAWSADGRFVYVALWGENSIAAVDLATIARVPAIKSPTPEVYARVVHITVGEHPAALALSQDGAQLFVVTAGDDNLTAIDTHTNRPRATVNVAPFDAHMVGASPNALAVSPDGSRVYVTCAATNSIAVVAERRGGLELLGALPTGWYPSAISLDPAGNSLFVANAKGDGSFANAGFDPYAGTATPGSIPTSLYGSVRKVAVPSDFDLERGTAEVIANSEPKEPAVSAAGRSVLSPSGPIKHVIYVLGGGHTYDQVLADIPQGDGQPQLAVYGENITPNQHALARRFGLFDRALSSGQTRFDGAFWATAAFDTDYVEKLWPPYLARRSDRSPMEDGFAARPHGGFLWNTLARAGLSVRNYGTFTSARDGRAGSPFDGLAAISDPNYPAHGNLARVNEWKREFEGFDRDGALPALELVAFDREGASAAGDDAALGTLVDTVSHSKFWNSTAIFVIETDAAGGPDHVDAHRGTLYVLSPYARGGVYHEALSTADVLRSIEVIFGLDPLSPYDASAHPLYDAFTPVADGRPFDAILTRAAAPPNPPGDPPHR